MVLLTDKLRRLQATIVVSASEAEVPGRHHMLSVAAKKVARAGLEKIVQECVTVDPLIPDPWTGTRLNLDVYVLTPAELENALAQAQADGARHYGLPPAAPATEEKRDGEGA